MWKNVPELVDITLLAVIGEGSYGVVHRAQSNSLGLVAAKTLHILLHPDRYFIQAEGEVYLMEEDHFRQEVEIMMKFSHPNIIKCFGVWFKSRESRKIPHMIFELGECTFDTFLFSNKLSQSQAIEFGVQIVKGIRYLHMQHSTAHRDIKPGNMVLFKEEDQSKQNTKSAERELEQKRRNEQQKIEAEQNAEQNYQEAVLQLQLAREREAQMKSAWESAKQEAAQAKWETKASENLVEKCKSEENQYTIKLIDFGESKYASRTMKTKVGTPIYRDPKVSTELYDKSVDVYSFACVLIQMLCGYEELYKWRISKEKQDLLPLDMVSKLGEELSGVVRSCIREENRIGLEVLLETLEALTPIPQAGSCVQMVEPTPTDHQFALALKFYCGDGVDKDLKKAVECFTAAANQGHSDAQNKLAYCYEKGEGVEKNLEKAVELYTAAANQGHSRAQCHLAYCYKKGEGVEKNWEKAVEWYTAAANQGYSAAQCNLAYCYYQGEGVEKNLKKAVELYTAAANQGHSRAQNNLGVCYEKGQGVRSEER